MVARWMQPKIAKMRKARFDKPKSYKHGAGFKNDQGQWVDMSMSSRARVGGGIKPSNGSFESIAEHKTPIEREPWLQSKFRDRNPFWKWDAVTQRYIPDENGIYPRAIGEGANPRALVFVRVKQMLGNTTPSQREEVFVYGKIVDGPYLKRGLYMGRQICFFMEWQKIGTKEVLRRSITYTGRSSALYAEQTHSIVWKEEVSSSLHPPNQPQVPSG